MPIAKVILNGQTLMDTTDKTVAADKLLSGETALKNDGSNVVGTVVIPTFTTQEKTVSPTESQQVVTPDTGKDGLSKVTVNAVPDDYVGSAITQDPTMTASGATVTAPAGYYSEAQQKSVATATHPSPTASINSTTGVVTASHAQGTGYVTGGTTTGTLNLTTQAAKTVSPTESEQTAVSAGRYTTGAVKVGAISSTYVGTGVARNDSTDLTASGATVTAPAGYYAQAATKTIASGTAGTPTATKGTVTNHSVTITPSVTNTAGYITGGTKTGTGVTVDVTELESGTKNIIENGTGISVSGYSTVNVNVAAEVTSGYTVTITGDSKYGARVEYDGKTYYNAGDVFRFAPGDTLTLTCVAEVRRISINGEVVASGDGQDVGTSTYGYTLPEDNITIALTVPKFGAYADLVTAHPVVEALTVNAAGTYETAHKAYSPVTVAEGSTAPSAAKSAVSNHSVTVTPSTANTAGYIPSGTVTGTGVTVAASELVSGTLSINSSGTKDVTNYASASVAAGSATTPATSITANPSISVDANGKITATASATKSVTPTVSAGYVSSGTAGTVTVSGSNTQQLTTQAAATITPTETEQTAVAAKRYTLGAVKVAAIPSNYVGSSIAQNDSDDLTASGATVTVPAGYYDEDASKSVATTTHPAPTMTFNSSTGVVTASHTQGTGYVTGGTTISTLNMATQEAKTVTPTETEQTAVAAGKYTTGAVKVGAISSTYVGSEITRRTYNDMTVSGAQVIAPAGYYANNSSKSVATGTAGTPTATKGTVSNHSVTVTPSVTNTTGYIVGGTNTGTGVTVTAAELVSGTKTITQNGTGIDVTTFGSVDVNVEDKIKTVNGILPDDNGNVQLPIDTAPTSGSTNPVTSNALYAALEALWAKINTPTSAMAIAT